MHFATIQVRSGRHSGGLARARWVPRAGVGAVGSANGARVMVASAGPGSARRHLVEAIAAACCALGAGVAWAAPSCTPANQTELQDALNGGCVQIEFTQKINITGDLTANINADVRIIGQLGGAGRIVKDGTGSLTLIELIGGSTDFSGGLDIRAGQVIGTPGALGGAGAGPVVTTAGLPTPVLSLSAPVGASLVVFQSDLTGGGALSVAGAGHVILGDGTATPRVDLEQGIKWSGSGLLEVAAPVQNVTSIAVGGDCGPALESSLDCGVWLRNAANTTTGNISVQGGPLILDHGLTARPIGSILSLGHNLVANGTFTLSDIVRLASASSSDPGGRIQVQAGQTLTLSGPVVDGTVRPDVFYKLGAGTLELTGANTYTSATYVTDGTLRGPASSLPGDLHVRTNATLELAQASDAVLAGRVLAAGNVEVGAGDGKFLKSGAGVLTLRSGSNFAGTTEVTGGALRLSADADLGDAAGKLVLNGGGLRFLANTANLRGFTLGAGGGVIDTSPAGINPLTLLADDFAHEVTVTGVIDGSGLLIKRGSGQLTLAGINSNTGGSQVDEGTLAGTTQSLRGAIANAGAVVFDQAFDGSFAGTISGTGTVMLQGSGSISLTGALTHTGGTYLANGTLRGNSDTLRGVIINGSRVVFDQGHDGTFAGSLSGGGALVKAGRGTLTVTGAVTQSGGITLQEGRLAVEGAGNLNVTDASMVHATPVTALAVPVLAPFPGRSTLLPNPVIRVEAGAELGGSGTIAGNPLIAAGGTLAPAPVGTPGAPAAPRRLRISGNLSFETGSSLRFGVAADGTSDQVTVTGAVQLGSAGQPGPLLDVRAADGHYAGETRYRLLSAGGGVSGALGGVTTDLAFLNPTASIEDAGIVLKLSRNDVSYTSVASGPNASGVGAALDAARLTGGAGPASGSLVTVLSALDAATAPAADVLLNDLGAAAHASAMVAGNQFGRAFQNEVGMAARAATGLRSRAGIFDRVRLAAASTGTASDAAWPLALLDANRERHAWLRGLALDGKINGDGPVAGVNYRGTGLTGGAALGLTPETGVGLAFSYLNARISAADGDHTRLRAPTVALFGTWESGPVQLTGGVSLGLPKLHSLRLIDLGGTPLAAAGERAGRELGLSAEASYGLPWGDAELRPFVGLQTLQTRFDGFTESGAGDANLTVEAARFASASGTAGLRYSLPFNAGRARLLASVAARQELGATQGSVTANFASLAPASGFVSTGVGLKRSAVQLGLGVAGELARNLDLYADLNVELRGGGQRQATASLKLRQRW